MTPLQKKRLLFAPKLPNTLRDLDQVAFSAAEKSEPFGDQEEIQREFPSTYGLPVMRAHFGKKGKTDPLNIGVVFSGGQAPGGHNVITGLFDAMKKTDQSSSLFGFLNGPSGIIAGKYKQLSENELKNYRNQGGFDLIGSDRTKIETDEQLSKAFETLKRMKLDALVIVGGDDSNTNAAVLAEYLIKRGSSTRIVGVPKTIDGDLQGRYLPISFGFDTACKAYSEMIGNIARDALSARKYIHFVKLMGRSASHITLECALKTQPNYTLIGEEVEAKGQRLEEIVEDLCLMVEERSRRGKNYGVVLVPEGLIEFIPEMKRLINELSGHKKPSDDLQREIPKEIPKEIQEQLLLDRDPHGNMQLSQVQTERLLSNALKKRLEKRGFKGKLNVVHHFFGYEGRSAFPSNFDANYCYSLGQIAFLIAREGLTGYMGCIPNLTSPLEDWEVYAVPITSLMHVEMRKGKRKPVVRKSLVDLNSAAFKAFESKRASWKTEDHYKFPGPMQFEGDPSCTDHPPQLIKLNAPPKKD